MIQVKIRRTCPKCEEGLPNPVCPDCKGTGWVESWFDLERLARFIRDSEPIEPAVNLDVQMDTWEL